MVRLDVFPRLVRYIRAIVLGTLVWSGPAVSAEGVRCASADFTVFNAGPGDLETVCGAVSDVVAFMSAHGIEVKRPTTIRVVPRLAEAQVTSTLGTFNGRTSHIEILTYEASRTVHPDKPPFGMEMNPAIYRSFIAHEVAHAIAHPNFVRRPLIAPHEYIAFTVQLATMPEELRRQVLETVRTDAFEHAWQASDVLMMLDPQRFAVKSYLHFTASPDPAAVFQQLLTGRFQ